MHDNLGAIGRLLGGDVDIERGVVLHDTRPHVLNPSLLLGVEVVAVSVRRVGLGAKAGPTIAGGVAGVVMAVKVEENHVVGVTLAVKVRNSVEFVPHRGKIPRLLVVATTTLWRGVGIFRPGVREEEAAPLVGVQAALRSLDVRDLLDRLEGPSSATAVAIAQLFRQASLGGKTKLAKLPERAST